MYRRQGIESMTEPSTDLVPRAPGPGTAFYRHFGDGRAGLFGPHALLLQVMHPVVDAGVLQHSQFKTEPFRRLFGTLLSTSTLVYGGPDGAAAESRRLRKLHTLIRGIDKNGERYHSLDPSAWTWVYATLVRASLDAQVRFGKELTRATVDEYYRGARELGLVMGIREKDLPADWDAFLAYFDATVESKLVDTESARNVLAFLSELPRPFFVPGFLWRPLSRPIASVVRLVTAGTLPEVVRSRLGLSWTERDTKRLTRFTRLVRFGVAFVPQWLRNVGPRIVGPINGRRLLRAEASASVASPRPPAET